MADNNDDQKIVYMETAVAEELLDLVADRPGEADEDLLDAAVAAIAAADSGLASEAQQAVARGDGVALGLADEEAKILTILIESNTEADKEMLKSISRALKSKLRAANKKAQSG